MVKVLMYICYVFEKKLCEIGNIVERATLIHSPPAANLASRTDLLSF